jgi:hypothetical protein
MLWSLFSYTTIYADLLLRQAWIIYLAAPSEIKPSAARQPSFLRTN